MNYGEKRYCLYDETDKNEFKVMPFIPSYPDILINFSEFIKEKINDAKIEETINDSIKEYLRLNPHFFINSLKIMFDKYFCNYVSCFHNSKYGTDCNLFFGVNDDGLEIGIPILKTDNPRIIIEEIYKSKLIEYINNYTIVLYDIKDKDIEGKDKNIGKFNSLDISPFVETIQVYYKKIDNITINNIHSKQNKLFLKIKTKILHYYKVNENISNKLKNIDKIKNIINTNNTLIIDKINEDFIKYEYWDQIMLCLEIDKINNKFIYDKIMTGYYNSFRYDCQNNYDSKTILTRIENRILDLKKFINEEIAHDINTINKIDHMLRVLSNDSTKLKIIQLIENQKFLETTVHNWEKRNNSIIPFINMYNQEILKKIGEVKKNNQIIDDHYRKLIKSFRHSSTDIIKIHNLEEILKYLITDYDFYIIKIVVPSPAINNGSILYKPIKIELGSQHEKKKKKREKKEKREIKEEENNGSSKRLITTDIYYLSKRGKVNKEISCLDIPFHKTIVLSEKIMS